MANLKSTYNTTVKKELMKTLNYTNEMQVPKVTKVVINMCVKEAVTDSKKIQTAVSVFYFIVELFGKHLFSMFVVFILWVVFSYKCIYE